jgi:hypothetical protein
VFLSSHVNVPTNPPLDLVTNDALNSISPTSDNGVYVTQVRHDRVGFILMPLNECYPYMQKKHDTMTQDSV